MTKGDNLIGIKTTYKGIEMRNKLETKVAMFLDALKIKWEYEPKTFLLSDGTPYRPDFYLPELKLWIEVKGLIEEHNKNISLQFVKENKTTLILFSSTEQIWYGVWEWQEEGKEVEYFSDKDVQIGFCSKCSKYFFCSNLGVYYCRNCENWEGDHDLIGILSDGCLETHFEKLDFSDIESIKRWLNARKISI